MKDIVSELNVDARINVPGQTYALIMYSVLNAPNLKDCMRGLALLKST